MFILYILKKLFRYDYDFVSLNQYFDILSFLIVDKGTLPNSPYIVGFVVLVLPQVLGISSLGIIQPVIIKVKFDIIFPISLFKYHCYSFIYVNMMQ